MFAIDAPEIIKERQLRAGRESMTFSENCFELPADFTGDDWAQALASSPAFSREKITFVGMKTLLHGMEKEDFIRLVNALYDLLPEGSSLAMNYPVEIYSPTLMEALLMRVGFLIYEHRVRGGEHFCLAVKK